MATPQGVSNVSTKSLQEHNKIPSYFNTLNMPAISQEFAIMKNMEKLMKSQHIPTALVLVGVVVIAYNFVKPSQTVEKVNTARQILNAVQTQKRSVEIPQDVETLRDAYTGKWFKNNPTQAQQAGVFNFTPPENTRNIVEAKKEDDKKKKEDLKKKQARKKKLQALKFAKRKAMNKGKGKSLFDYTLDDKGIPEFIYYPYNQPQNNQQQAQGEQPEKKWTIEELLAKATSTNSVSELVGLYKSADINADIFYGVVDKLFESSTESHHTLGYSALSQTPSIASFARHVSYLEDETSEEIRVLATTQLDIYKQITNLSILNSALNNSERGVQSTSALYLQQVADFLLQSSTPTTGENESERNPSSLTPRVLERYRSILRQSVSIMSTLIQSGRLDAELVNVYTQSKTRIEQFLNQAPAQQNIAGF